MTRAPLTWDDLRYLEALSRTGKVSAAARDQGVSQSTFYRRIAELEQHTGQLCIERSRTAPPSLTAFGRTLAEVGRETREGLQRAVSRMRERENTVAGEVTLTTVIGLLPLIQQPLAALAHRHPELQVSLHLGDDGPSVRNRQVDVALSVVQRPPQGCWGRKVYTMTSGVFGTREAVAATPRRWVLRALQEATQPDFAWEQAHAGACGLRAPFHAMVNLCAAGAGLVLMPHILARQHPQLVEAQGFSELKSLDRHVWLLTHPDQRTTPRVVALMKALTSAFD